MDMTKSLSQMTTLPLSQLVIVCDKCLCASCWHGVFQCDDAPGAGTTELMVEQLLAMEREPPSWWDICPVHGVAKRAVATCPESASERCGESACDKRPQEKSEPAALRSQETPYSFGELVAYHKRSSYTELASRCGVSRRTLSRWSQLSSAPRSLEALRFLEWMQKRIEKDIDECESAAEMHLERVSADLASIVGALEPSYREKTMELGEVYIVGEGPRRHAGLYIGDGELLHHDGQRTTTHGHPVELVGTMFSPGRLMTVLEEALVPPIPCSSCGYPTSYDSRYCGGCGVSLLTAEEQIEHGCPVCDDARLEMLGGMMVTCTVCR
jgi:transcriptional regulator with XRE-family HTH domain